MCENIQQSMMCYFFETRCSYCHCTIMTAVLVVVAGILSCWDYAVG